MSARDDYPRIGRTQSDLAQWQAMCDEIDTLRSAVDRLQAENDAWSDTAKRRTS